MFIHNFMRAKAAIEIAKQARPVFAKFIEVRSEFLGNTAACDLAKSSTHTHSISSLYMLLI